MPVRTEMSVVLPAPLGPSKPKISPFWMPSVNGLRAIFPFYPLSEVYRLERPLVTSGNAETGEEERSCACWVTEWSMGAFYALLTVSLYISAISISFSPSDCPSAESDYSASSPSSRFLRMYFRVFSSQGGLLATPYSCWTIQFMQTASRNISTHPQRTPMQRISSPLASLKFLMHYMESAQALPRMQTMRLRARGGQSVSRKGRVIGVGKMTVQMGMPMRVLKMERTYPTIVADLAESMKIWTRAAIESCAMAHPMKMAQSRPQEVLTKKVTQMMYLPARNMTPAQVRLMAKLTMKQFSQQERIYSPFMRIICSCRYSFSETSVQSRRGRSRLSPKGQRPDPMTLTILLTKVLSSPEKGMYMMEPAITSLLSLPPSLTSRNALVSLSISPNSPSVTLRQVLMVVVCEVLTTILVAPLFLWYSGRRQSLIPRTARMAFLLAYRNLTVPSGMSVLRSSPRSKASVLAFSRQLMTAAFTESTLLNLGESPPSGQTSFSCVLMRYSAKGLSLGGDWKQQSCWQERPSWGRMSESSRGRERGCGQGLEQTAPVVMPPTICRTAKVKRRHRMGLMT